MLENILNWEKLFNVNVIYKTVKFMLFIYFQSSSSEWNDFGLHFLMQIKHAFLVQFSTGLWILGIYNELVDRGYLQTDLSI